MNYAEVFKLVLSKLATQYAFDIFAKLSDRKLTPEELRDLTTKLLVLVASSVNDVYASSHGGTRPISGIDVKL